MNTLSRRIAALTPRITVALVLFTIGLTGLLAYRALDASRAQQRLVERTLRDYAGFAAFQLKNATFSRFTLQHRQATDSVVAWVNSRGTQPRLDARRLAGLLESRGPICPCVGKISFFYEVSIPDSTIVTSASPLATSDNVREVRDTVIANARSFFKDLQAAIAMRPGAQFANVQFFLGIFTRLGDRPYVLAYTLTMDGDDGPLVAYGYAVPAEEFVGNAVEFVLRTQPVLPRALIRELKPDSILTVRVTDAQHRQFYETTPAPDPQFTSVDSLDARIGGLRFEVAISPVAAGRLIIGGLPQSRLPEVLATAFVAASLLGLLLYQFRRQEELGRLREEFVSGVSHELRTPLAQIRLLAELLRMGKVPTDDQKDRSLRIIDKEARRLSFLVDSILRFTRSQHPTLSPVRTDVAAEIEEIVTGFEPLAHAHSVELTMHLQRSLMADVDRDALRQIVINLLDNAVRYGPPGQEVTITTASAGDTWTIEVADEGPGIPANERERIFAPYYRMKRDMGGAVGGTGIGLAVVRRLVEQHHGQVRVATSNGEGARGARFVVTLPIAAEGVSGT